jgi:hypothetical protein
LHRVTPTADAIQLDDISSATALGPEPTTDDRSVLVLR